MLFILWYSFVVILLTPTNIYSHSSVVTSEDNSKFVSDTEEKDVKHIDQTGHISSAELSEQNYSGEEVEESNENSGHEQAEASNDLLDANYVPLTKSSSEIRFAPDTALPHQDETNSDLKQESSSQTHEFEFKESTETDLNRLERDFASHPPSAIEMKTTYQVDTEQKSEMYQSSGNKDTLSIPENPHKQRTDGEDFQHLGSDETQISQTNEPVHRLLDHGQIERSFTEVDEETLLMQTSESFSQELVSTIESKSLEQSETDGNINEGTLLEETGERLTHEMAGNTELNPKERAEVKDGFKFNVETLLDQIGERFPHELVSTIELKSMEQAETDGNTDEGALLELTRERLTREMAGNTELNLKGHSEVEDGLKLNEDIHLNQTIESFMRESANSTEAKPAQQAEGGDGLKSISQNGLSENSYVNDNDIEKSVGRDENDNFHLFNSSLMKINKGNVTDSGNNLFNRISDLNSHEESKLALEPFQRTNNSENKLPNDIGLFYDVALPKEKATVKENFIPSNNTDNIYLAGNSEESENLQVRNIDSQYTASNTTFTSETEHNNVVESSKQPDSMHIINYQSEPDNLIRNNTESLVLKDIYDEINSDEVKANERNQREFISCGITDCSETAISADHESADFSSELIPKIQRESIRAVGRALARAMNSKLIRNDSAHEKNQSAYEYLENIEFNLHEVIYIIKTDSNVRAFILNSIILYVPVLICDVFLWVVIVKLIRHIRRFLVSNQQPKPSQSLLTQEDESEDVDRLVGSRLNPLTKSKRSGKENEDDFYDSSSEFSEQKVWYPPS